MDLSPSRRRARILLLILPSLIWLLVFFLIPLLIVLAMSFGKRGTYGGVEWILNLGNIQRLFESLYVRIFFRSIFIAGVTTLVCLLIGYPLAYWIATRKPARRNTFVLLLIVPFWTNFLVRTYAWILILRDQGIVNLFWTGTFHRWMENLALAIPGGLTASLVQATANPIPLFGTNFAIIIGLVYAWLPDMVLPCYAAIERLDFSLAEAAQDLYANRVRTFLKIVLPLTLPGILAGSILVFIPSLGAYVTPDLLGGAKTVMIGNVIYSQFMSARDYPFGAAVSMVLMTLMIFGTLFYFRIGTQSPQGDADGRSA
jgi:spermidine/putrescine transport system permease protein